MRRTLATLAALTLAALTLALTACSGDDDGDGQNEDRTSLEGVYGFGETHAYDDGLEVTIDVASEFSVADSPRYAEAVEATPDWDAEHFAEHVWDDDYDWHSWGGPYDWYEAWDRAECDKEAAIDYVLLDVTLTNGGSEVYDPDGWSFRATSEGVEGSSDPSLTCITPEEEVGDVRGASLFPGETRDYQALVEASSADDLRLDVNRDYVNLHTIYYVTD